MKNNMKKTLITLAILAVVLMFNPPAKSYALNVIPVDMNLYAISGTPVYAVPDVYSGVVVVLDRFVQVKVTGITYNGFYQIDLNGNYYVPGAFLIQHVAPEKTEKQKVLENLEKYADAYVMLLEQMESYSATFGLMDVTGDGIPEIFDSEGKEIFTYYNEKPVMMYYLDRPTDFYYSKAHNQLLGNYKWNEISVWELYNKDVSILPWGQFKCIGVATSDIYNKANKVTHDYVNNSSTRANMYNILKKYMEIK